MRNRNRELINHPLEKHALVIELLRRINNSESQLQITEASNQQD